MLPVFRIINRRISCGVCAKWPLIVISTAKQVKHVLNRRTFYGCFVHAKQLSRQRICRRSIMNGSQMLIGYSKYTNNAISKRITIQFFFCIICLCIALFINIILRSRTESNANKPNFDRQYASSDHRRYLESEISDGGWVTDRNAVLHQRSFRYPVIRKWTGCSAVELAGQRDWGVPARRYGTSDSMHNTGKWQLLSLYPEYQPSGPHYRTRYCHNKSIRKRTRLWASQCMPYPGRSSCGVCIQLRRRLVSVHNGNPRQIR